jgi:hypothetical protein
MLSSYQVVLWIQESFGVPRLLQIEFFRSLLEVELHRQLYLPGCVRRVTDRPEAAIV